MQNQWKLLIQKIVIFMSYIKRIVLLYNLLDFLTVGWQASDPRLAAPPFDRKISLPSE